MEVLLNVRFRKIQIQITKFLCFPEAITQYVTIKNDVNILKSSIKLLVVITTNMKPTSQVSLLDENTINYFIIDRGSAG